VPQHDPVAPGHIGLAEFANCSKGKGAMLLLMKFRMPLLLIAIGRSIALMLGPEWQLTYPSHCFAMPVQHLLIEGSTRCFD
jgi:hypothetical protein